MSWIVWTLVTVLCIMVAEGIVLLVFWGLHLLDRDEEDDGWQDHE